MLAAPYNEAFSSRVFRFVNNNDVVTRVPPEPVFHHVDDVRYFDSDGVLREKPSFTGGLADGIKGLTGDPLAPGADGVRDHFIDHYVELVEKNLS